MKDSKKPYRVCAWLITINTIVFFLVCSFGSIGTGQVFNLDPSANLLLDWGAGFGPLNLEGEYWRFLSYGFLHGSLLHLLVNMYVLWKIGIELEDIIGSWSFILIYLISTIFGGLASVGWQPTVVSVGASGAIFGIFGAAFSCERSSRIPQAASREEIRKRKIIALSVFIALNCAFAMVFPAIDNAAHMGGLAAGIIMGFLFSRRPDRKNFLYPLLVSMAMLALAGTSLKLLQNKYAGETRLAAYKALFESIDLAQSDKLEDSLTNLDRAVSLAPDEITMRSKRAQLLMKMEKFEDAIQDLNVLLAYDESKEPDNKFLFPYAQMRAIPSTGRLLLMKGVCLSHLGKHEEAELVYEKILNEEQSPDAIVYNNLAWSQIAQGKLDKAASNINYALSKDESLSSAMDTRGVLLHLQGKSRDAIVELNKAALSQKEEGATYFHRSLAKLALGLKKEAQADYEKSKELKYEPEEWEAKKFAVEIDELRDRSSD